VYEPFGVYVSAAELLDALLDQFSSLADHCKEEIFDITFS
jgi:hypothetical protein